MRVTVSVTVEITVRGPQEELVSRPHAHACVQVEGQWWSTNPEPDKEYQARIQELVSQVHTYAHVACVCACVHRMRIYMCMCVRMCTKLYTPD